MLFNGGSTVNSLWRRQGAGGLWRQGTAHLLGNLSVLLLLAKG